MTDDLCCREVSEFLLEYFDDTLAVEVRVSFDTHVAGCQNCRTFLEQYGDTIRAGKLACCDDGVSDCPEDLVKAVMEALTREPRTDT